MASFRSAKTLVEGRMRLSCRSCKLPGLSDAKVVDMRTRLLCKAFWKIRKIKEIRVWRNCDTRSHNGTLLSQCFFYFFCPHPSSLYCEEHVYIYTHLTAYRLYMNYLCHQITLQWNVFTQIRSGAKCWLDIYRWGAGLAVSWPIRDIGQNVLQSFETGSSSSHSYCHILLLIAFLEEDLIIM